MNDQQETKENGELRFYYNREERLKKASSLAQYTNSLYTRKKPGLFASMTATGPLKFLFFSIIVLALLIFGYELYQKSEKSVTIQGIKFSAKAMRFEHDLYITVHREATYASDLQKQVYIKVQYSERQAESTFPPGEVETGIKLENFQENGKGNISIEIVQENKKATFFVKLP